MGHLFRAEDNPMGFMEALVQWHVVSFSVDPKGDWHAAMDAITAQTTAITDGRFFVTMDREDEMTDNIAYFNIRCEDQDDAEGVVLIFENAILHTPPPAPPRSETPEWLKKFAKT